MTLLDQRTDTSRAFLVKTASRLHDRNLASKIMKIAEDSSAPASHFACSDGLLFPVDSREQTMLSRMYFNGQRDMFNEKTAAEIDSTLTAYENLYGIYDDFSLLGLRKTAAQETYELLPGYKVRGAGGLKQAKFEFMEKQAKMAIEDRVSFSMNFIKAASEEGMDVPEKILQYGGEYACDYDKLQSGMRLRKIAAKRAGKDGSAYEKLADMLTKEAMDKASQEDLACIAGQLQGMDESFGFDAPYYDSRMPNAWNTVFNTKTAEETGTDSGTANAKNPESMTKADVIARFGEDALDAIENENGDIDYKRLKEVIRMFDGGQGDGGNAKQ